MSWSPPRRPQTSSRIPWRLRFVGFSADTPTDHRQEGGFRPHTDTSPEDLRAFPSFLPSSPTLSSTEEGLPQRARAENPGLKSHRPGEILKQDSEIPPRPQTGSTFPGEWGRGLSLSGRAREILPTPTPVHPLRFGLWARPRAQTRTGRGPQFTRLWASAGRGSSSRRERGESRVEGPEATEERSGRRVGRPYVRPGAGGEGRGPDRNRNWD